MDDAWTEAKIFRLRELNASGLTRAQIAFELQVTKNAVIGKSRRLGLVSANPPPKSLANLSPESREKQRLAREARRKSSPPQSQSSPREPQGPPLTPVEPGPPIKLCQWPLGEPRKLGFHLCGKPAKPSSVYCATHHGLAYNTRAA